MSDHSFHMEIESETRYLAPVREGLRTFLKSAGLNSKDLESVLVAMGEACTNCIRHSYHNEAGHKIVVDGQSHADRVVLKIRDWGEKFDRSKVKKPQLPPEKGGGLGVYFMETIMDEMTYNTALDRGNELILVKYKKGAVSS